MMSKDSLSQNDKTLITIYELEKEFGSSKKITVEDIAVKSWKLYPKDFCMKGYPQFPHGNNPKYMTKLLENNLVIGGVYSYKLTSKGREYAEKLLAKKLSCGKDKRKDSKEVPRHISEEISRIVNSKVFRYYLENKSPELVDSDLFDFLGTSSRSLLAGDKNVFLSRYNAIVKDVIPFCREKQAEYEYAREILDLWLLLYDKFKSLIENKIK